MGQIKTSSIIQKEDDSWTVLRAEKTGKGNLYTKLEGIIKAWYIVGKRERQE